MNTVDLCLRALRNSKLYESASKVGWLKPSPVLTGGYNQLKPPPSILPKVVNTGQLKILVVDWSYIWSMDQLKGLKNNCFVRNWSTVYYLASIVGLVGLGVQL